MHRMAEKRCIEAGTLNSDGYERMFEQSRRVYDTDGAAPTMHTAGGGNQEPKIKEINGRKFRIRKLTEKECGRLMGVRDEDIALLSKRQSRSSQYHLFGDSIVSACLMAIFGVMLDVDYNAKIDELARDISAERAVVGAQISVPIINSNTQGYDIANDGDSVNLAFPGSSTRRGRVGHGVSQTLDTGCQMGILEGSE